MMDIAIRYNLAVISDDAHMDIIYKPYHYTPIAKIWGNYEKAALITSTAKGFNTASLGGSYIIFNSQKDREWFMTDLKIRGLSSAPILFVIGTIAAYTKAEPWLDAFIDAMQDNLNYIRDFLKQHLPAITIAKEEGTYFAWLNVSGLGLSAEELQKKLVDKGKVAMMDGRVYHQQNPLYLRLNVACPRSKVEDGMQRLLKSLS